MSYLKYSKNPIIASRLSERFPLVIKLLAPLPEGLEIHIFLADLKSEEVLSKNDNVTFWSKYPKKGSTEETISAGKEIYPVINTNLIYQKHGLGNYILNAVIYDPVEKAYGDVNQPGILILQNIIYPGQ